MRGPALHFKRQDGPNVHIMLLYNGGTYPKPSPMPVQPRFKHIIFALTLEAKYLTYLQALCCVQFLTKVNLRTGGLKAPFNRIAYGFSPKVKFVPQRSVFTTENVLPFMKAFP